MNIVNAGAVNPDFIQGQIISRLNLDYLPEAERVKLLDSMAEVVSQRVLLKVLQTLPKDKSEALAKLLDEGADNEVAKFMEENVSDFLTILQTELDAVTNELTLLTKN
jgi:hypothetical protein